MRGDKALTKPISPEAAALVEQHHNIINCVMKYYSHVHECGGDIYGDCALALMVAAQIYVDRPSLHKYPFSAVAWRRCAAVIAGLVKRREMGPNIVSLDAPAKDSGACIHEFIPASEYTPEASTRCLQAYQLVEQVLSKEQLDAVKLISNGVLYAEGAKMLKISPNTFNTRVRTARKRMKSFELVFYPPQRKSARQSAN